MSAQEFNDEQRRYLEGFVSGVQAGRTAQGLKPLGGIGGGGVAAPSGPDASHLAAMARTEAAGKKLVGEEKAKRDEHPLDAYPRLRAEAAAGLYPKGIDNFRWRFHGLFYVAPAQPNFMCRLRIANGILSHWQLAGVADLAERYGGGYAHVSTRANLQIREIAAEQAVPLIEGLADIGLTPKGSGADNIRNVTGSPTAGIDPQELLDTRPYARAWHHHILNQRVMYGLPRKFNVAFEGGGAVPVLEDTNDIAFTAVTVKDGFGVTPGVWFRLGLGGITGHHDFARPTGVYLPPADATAVADAVIRVFIDSGNRTDRTKARLKYVLDDWGFEKFLSEVESKIGRPLVRLPNDAVLPPPPQNREAHVGVHPQIQPGKVWIGIMPNQHSNLIGLSKYARLANWMMNRPQIQEEAITQIAELLMTIVKPDGLAVVMEAEHFCLHWRGVKDHSARMINSVMRGSFLEDQALRREFLSLMASRSSM